MPLLSSMIIEETVSIELVGQVAHVSIRRPPVNSLNRATRQQLVDAILRCQNTAQVSAIVLAGGGVTFCAGADLNELEDADSFFCRPRIVDVAQCIEDCTKPVVAAIRGNCLGGGLEIALAAHYRVADASAMLGLPEVLLGVLPAAGGTQRLPRLVGVNQALKMMLDGAPVAAREFTGMPLFDQVVGGNVVQAAEAFAARLPSNVKHTPTSERRAPADTGGTIAAARHALAGDPQRSYRLARGKIIDAVEICLTGTLIEGLDFEQDAAQDLIHSYESRALRHAFLHERALRRSQQSVQSDNR